MSISVGAILLPAAFHFTLEDTGADTAAAQGKYILHMSHGVCTGQSDSRHLLMHQLPGFYRPSVQYAFFVARLFFKPQR
jgi:hypothetical protein